MQYEHAFSGARMSDSYALQKVPNRATANQFMYQGKGRMRPCVYMKSKQS